MAVARLLCSTEIERGCRGSVSSNSIVGGQSFVFDRGCRRLAVDVAVVPELHNANHGYQVESSMCIATAQFLA
jgi:hypothetical protein